jgi:hypothetical protein
MTTIQCGDLKFYTNTTNKFTIQLQYNHQSQGILSLYRSHDGITLYMWFDEGYFPDFFDMSSDEHRLLVVGVDEI